MDVKLLFVRIVKFALLGGGVFFLLMLIIFWRLPPSVIYQAKYPEASSVISALRTKIIVYQFETGRLPGLEVEGRVQLLGGESPWQKALDIADGDYSGVYFKDENYQYYVEQPSSNAWIYCVGASGDGSGKAPQKGTAYAVIDINNPAWGKCGRVVAVFGRYYVPDSNFNRNEPLTIQAFNTVDPGDEARANCIPTPTWSVVTGALTTADGNLDLQLLEKNFGFCVQ